MQTQQLCAWSLPVQYPPVLPLHSPDVGVSARQGHPSPTDWEQLAVLLPTHVPEAEGLPQGREPSTKQTKSAPQSAFLWHGCPGPASLEGAPSALASAPPSLSAPPPAPVELGERPAELHAASAAHARASTGGRWAARTSLRVCMAWTNGDRRSLRRDIAGSCATVRRSQTSPSQCFTVGGSPPDAPTEHRAHIMAQRMDAPAKSRRKLRARKVLPSEECA
jgi:hypothetical protein